MKTAFSTRLVACIFLIVLFISCEQQEVSSVSLIGDSENSIAYIGEETNFSGTVAGQIESIEVYLDDSILETVGVENGKFSFSESFLELGPHRMILKGMDAGGETLAEANYRVLVVERSDVDHGMFDFGFPKHVGEGARDLWATYYYLPEVSSLKSGYPLRNMSGSSLGPVLSLKNWCFAAMEGSVRVVDSNGTGVTYNYAGTADGYEVDCKKFFSWNVSRTKFRVARGEYGDGVRRYKLIPYRTIAVDRTRIPYGSIVYIPEARGNEITLPDGTKEIHDGYFFAGDTGGAIKGAHIDVYIGVAKTNPFSWVKSTASRTFKAYVVEDEVIKEKLTNIHLK
jgi:3D (Asp-Asp-Asp) domain-containing protein